MTSIFCNMNSYPTISRSRSAIGALLVWKLHHLPTVDDGVVDGLVRPFLLGGGDLDFVTRDRLDLSQTEDGGVDTGRARVQVKQPLPWLHGAGCRFLGHRYSSLF